MFRSSRRFARRPLQADSSQELSWWGCGSGLTSRQIRHKKQTQHFVPSQTCETWDSKWQGARMAKNLHERECNNLRTGNTYHLLNYGRSLFPLFFSIISKSCITSSTIKNSSMLTVICCVWAEHPRHCSVKVSLSPL